MALSKQETIEKILSFTYEELARWMKSRLRGFDKYFPVFEGHEPNLSEFLEESFYHIKNEKYRENFLEILGDLTIELWGLSKDKKKVEEDKEYIYQLLSLCGRIEKFRNKSILYRIARSGNLKGVKVHNLELHQLLLTALASLPAAGDYKFWIEQMYDDSNKYYANAAFYALLSRGFSLDILFEHIGVFIDRFKGEIDLVLGIRALLKDYRKDEIIRKFRIIEDRLSREQKEAVNNAFMKSGYDPVYKLDVIEEELGYKVAAPQPQYVAAPTPKYKPGATLKEKAAEIFKLMGYEVELNRQIADHSIDIFLKKKKSIGNRYECWICFCDTGNRRVGKAAIHNLYPIREAVREELEKQPGRCDDCQAIIISEKGFTKGAIEAAKVYGIELKNLDQLAADLQDFHQRHKQLIQKDQEAE